MTIGTLEEAYEVVKGDYDKLMREADRLEADLNEYNTQIEIREQTE